MSTRYCLPRLRDNEVSKAMAMNKKGSAAQQGLQERDSESSAKANAVACALPPAMYSIACMLYDCTIKSMAYSRAKIQISNRSNQTTAHKGRGISDLVRLGRRVLGSVLSPT